MHILHNSDVALHVKVHGPEHGRAVMFSNSLGTDLRVWDALVAQLPNDLRIIRYDKRGHGLSDCPDPPYSMNALVDDAEIIADTFASGGVTFVGLSIGGLIGQGLAARRQDLVKNLVLMDTGAKIGNAEMWAARIEALRGGGIAAIADAILERWFAPTFRNSPDVVPWRNMLVRTPAQGYIGCCEAIAATDLTTSTQCLTCPVLALVGAEDGSTPPDLVKATADLCGAEFHVIEDAGHLPGVEQPEATARLIRDFLERTKG